MNEPTAFTLILLSLLLLTVSLILISLYSFYCTSKTWEFRGLRIKKSFKPKIKRYRNGYAAKYVPFSIYTDIHTTKGTALVHFWIDFVDLWYEYAEKPDDKLTLDAIELKKKLREVASRKRTRR